MGFGARRVAVIGAGLQGAGIALELAIRGIEVDLFEKRDVCLGQASLQNEGKIHLGFVYAKDPSLATARLLVQGALAFAPLLREWLEEPLPPGITSSPFQYLVHRNSVVDPDELERHYGRVSALARAGTTYFGVDPGQPVRRVAGSNCSDQVQAVFQTPEIAVDPLAIAQLVRARLEADPRIAIHFNRNVVSVEPTGDRVTVTTTDSERITYSHVVNASWESLPALDSTAGIPARGAGCFRMKYFIRIPGANLQTASATIVLGPFGDVVNYENGDAVLSWYPVGRRELVDARAMPTGEELDGSAAAEVRCGTWNGLRAIVPALNDLRIDNAAIYGGLIYALGQTDIDDPASGLHQRHAVGVRSFGRYHTVDTGKYTLAPLFARMTADRIGGA